MNNNIILWLWLKNALYDDTVKTANMYKKYGSITDIYNLTKNDLSDCNFLSDELKVRLCDKSTETAKTIYSRCNASAIGIITIDDEKYPNSLKEINFPPCVLFYFGNYEKAFSKPSITIVGTRKCTAYGEMCTLSFSNALAMSGISIVTGIADGIDSYATKGALKADGSVIAIAPSGLLSLNVKIRNNIDDYRINGVILSEHLPNTQTHKYSYHERNRLLSALSLGTLITQAPHKSGALITANHALEQGKDVFAIPANIDIIVSEGSNQLIKDGAIPVFSYKDIIDYYLPELDGKIKQDIRFDERTLYKTQDKIETFIEIEEYKRSVSESLTPNENVVFSYFSDKEITFDYLINKTTLPVPEISAILSVLEAKGVIKSLPGGKYKIII